MAARRTPRPKATKKIFDITRRLVEAEPPLDRMRTLWVFGSYARGAPDVGDLDLLGQTDDDRTPGKQALDSYYRRAHPYAEVVKALGCGGGSIASLVVEPVFQPAREPISPERAAAETSLDGFEVPRLPPYGHIVTGDLFDPQPQLLWVRGDDVELVQKRLRRFPSDPSARRLERTTTVPLLDELLPLLGVETGFQLAAQLRAGNLSVRAFILEATAPPPECAEMLDMRYTPASTRRVAGAAALAHMHRDGFDLGAVLFCDGPALSYSEWSSRDERQRPRAAIDFNPFALYKLAAGDYPQDWTHLHVWPRPRRGRWLAIEVRVLSAEGSRELYHQLHRRLFTGERGHEARYAPIREALGMPPLPPPTPLTKGFAVGPKDAPGRRVWNRLPAWARLPGMRALPSTSLAPCCCAATTLSSPLGTTRSTRPRARPASSSPTTLSEPGGQRVTSADVAARATGLRRPGRSASAVRCRQ